jgi:hypothetical protein
MNILTAFPSMLPLTTSSVLQLAGGAEKKTNPGRDGTTTLNNTFFPLALIDDCINGLMTGRNSWNEPVKTFHFEVELQGVSHYLLIRGA